MTLAFPLMETITFGVFKFIFTEITGFGFIFSKTTLGNQLPIASSYVECPNNILNTSRNIGEEFNKIRNYRD